MADRPSVGLTLRDYALSALQVDVAPLPPKENGTKMPVDEPWIDDQGKPIIDPAKGRQGYGWKHRQTYRARPNDIERWYGSGRRTGFGIVCGAVSGKLQPLPEGMIGPPAVLGLEMVEFEDRERWDSFVELAHQIGFGPLVDRIASGYLSATPGNGVHTLIRSLEYADNLKLAFRPATPAERAVKPDEDWKVIAETRGQGGFTVEPPSNGSVHPTGKPYRFLSGGLGSIVTVTGEERQTFLDLIQSFNERPDDEPSLQGNDVETRKSPDLDDVIKIEPAWDYDGPTALDVIAAYNARTTWDELLTRHGWRRDGGTPAGVSFWTRHGKTDPGHSATTNYGGSDKQCVFSTTPKLKVTSTKGSKAGYDRFGFYAAVEHNDDTKAAIRAASALLGLQGQRNGTSSASRGTSSASSSAPHLGRVPGGKTDSSASSASSASVNLPNAPEFPIDSLPEPVRSYVEAGGKALGAPIGLIATPILVFAGATLGNEHSLELKTGYRQRPTLYAADVAPPGSVKTPSIDFARYPLDVLQTEAHDRFKSDVEQYEHDLAAWEALPKQDKHNVLKPAKPAMTHYFTTNTTSEALVPMLGSNRGISIFHDEMTAWVHQMNAYRGGKGGDRQAYLSQWAGSQLKIDRKGQDSQYVPHPVIGVVGGVQPELLSDLADEGGRRDGFVERILWDYPEIQPGTWTDDTVDELSQASVVALFRKLRLSTSDRPVRLDSASKAVWRSWYDDNARAIQTASGVTAGIYAKLPNQLARLALILHCMTNPDAPSGRLLNEDTLADAVELVEYYRAMANRVVVHFNAQPASGTAGFTNRIAAFLRRRGGWVKFSEINKYLGGHFTSKAIIGILTDLEDDGLIEIEKAAVTVGRPAWNFRWKNTQAEEAEEAEEPSAPPGSAPFRVAEEVAEEAEEVVDEVIDRDAV